MNRPMASRKLVVSVSRPENGSNRCGPSNYPSLQPPVSFPGPSFSSLGRLETVVSRHRHALMILFLVLLLGALANGDTGSWDPILNRLHKADALVPEQCTAWTTEELLANVRRHRHSVCNGDTSSGAVHAIRGLSAERWFFLHFSNVTVQPNLQARDHKNRPTTTMQVHADCQLAGRPSYVPELALNAQNCLQTSIQCERYSDDPLLIINSREVCLYPN